MEQSVPTNQMVVTSKIGGLTLGAFDDRGELVGLSLGFPALDRAEPYLWSDILVIRRDLRGSGVGKRMKWAQREAALARGYRQICWTYDPLQAVNARLNIRTLGATVDTYLEDIYGEMQDSLNQGLPTDRLVACWDLLSPRVAALAGGAPPPELQATAFPSILHMEEGVPVAADLGLTAPTLLCPIPATLDQLRRDNPEASLCWRMAVRQALTHYLGQGYLIDSLAEPAPGLVAYLLRTQAEE